MFNAFPWLMERCLYFSFVYCRKSKSHKTLPNIHNTPDTLLVENAEIQFPLGVPLNTFPQTVGQISPSSSSNGYPLNP